MRRSLPPYLERRPSAFYFRRRLPLHFGEKNAFDANKVAPDGFDPTAAICPSLFTTHLTDAKRIARRLTAASDALFDAVMERSDMPVSAQLIIAILTDVRDQEIRAFEARRATAPARDDAAVSAALARETQIQAALRQAIALGERDTALEPLKAALTRAGISLFDAHEDWAALAHNANRVLLEVSQERARREAGLYSASEPVLKQIATELAIVPDPALPVFRSARVEMPTDAFCSTMTEAPQALACPGTNAVAPVSFVRPASRNETKAVEADPANPLVHHDDHTSPATADAPRLPATVPAQMHPVSAFLGSVGTLLATSAPYERVTELPALRLSLDDLRIDASLLSDAARAFLRDPLNGTIEELYNCFFEVKRLGYGDKFHKTQKRNRRAGENFEINTFPSLDVARRFWSDYLGNCRINEVTDKKLDHALDRLWRLPKLHGKKYPTDAGFQDLIDWADQQEIDAVAKVERALALDPEISAEAEDKMRSDALIKRIRSETYLKHGRAMGRMGRFLEGLGVLPRNPFALCCWNSDEEIAFKANEEDRARSAWDDRLYELFRTPEFQGQAKDPGSVIFWSVMVAVHLGPRLQEVLQLRLDDFGYEDGH